MATATLDKDEAREALTARLLSRPVPHISVDDYALFAGRSRPKAYEDVREGRVEVIRRGRSIRVPVPPLLRAYGYEVPTVGSLEG